MTKRPTAAGGRAMMAAMLVPQDDDMEVAPKVETKQDSSSAPVKRVDGRTLQATGRTQQFATRIKAETHAKMIEIVQREKKAGQSRFTLAELIELAIDAYEKQKINESL